MTSKATTVAQYFKELPEDRRKALLEVRKVILKNIDKGFQETMQYGGPVFSVPHSIFPAGYHCDPKQPLPFAGVASQKHFMAIYLMCIYYDKPTNDWFIKEWKATGKKLDMGKSCIRFKKLEDVPLEVIGKFFKKVTLKKFVKFYEDGLGARSKKR